jgi:hypothetical protein
MIDEVDEALGRLLHSAGLEQVEIRFDLDVDGGASASCTPPVLCLRLVDVSEDVGARAPCWEDVVEDGRVRWRRPPLRWYRLSYELSARADCAAAEHRLLSDALRCLVLHDQLPAEVLTGSLHELEQTVTLGVATPRPTPVTTTDPRQRASLAVVVTAPLRPAARVLAARPPERTQLAVHGTGTGPDTVTARPGDAAMRRPPAPPPAVSPPEEAARRRRRLPAPS